MEFSEKLKQKRKEFGMSQEQLAEKIGVSRQAITKWETDNGMPDIDNILAIASIFGTTVDELLSSEKELKFGTGFFHESITEYDIDAVKHYDINIGGACEITLESAENEKLRVRLASNAISSLEQAFKVKIDDNKNNIDVDVNRADNVSEGQAKEALHVFISVPAKFLAGVEIAARASMLQICNIETENIEFDGKVSLVRLNNVKSPVELNSTSDMSIVCENLCGSIGVNQISAASIIHLPRGTEYQVKKRRAVKHVRYTLDGKEQAAPEYPDAQNLIKVSGINSELIINECTNITKAVQ